MPPCAPCRRLLAAPEIRPPFSPRTTRRTTVRRPLWVAPASRRSTCDLARGAMCTLWTDVFVRSAALRDVLESSANKAIAEAGIAASLDDNRWIGLGGIRELVGTSSLPAVTVCWSAVPWTRSVAVPDQRSVWGLSATVLVCQEASATRQPKSHARPSRTAGVRPSPSVRDPEERPGRRHQDQHDAERADHGRTGRQVERHG